MIKQEVFEKAANEWKEFKQFPWSKMRYDITNELIENELDKDNISILNIGCGDGIETFLLDHISAEHTLVDYSNSMLNETDKFLKENNFKSKYTLIQSDVHEIKDKLNDKYELILFHNVLEYVEDPIKAISNVKSLLKKDGLLSIRHLNRYTNFCAAASYEKNLEKVERYLDSPFMDSSFGVPIQTYTGEEILSFLNKVGFYSIQRFGLMTLNTFITDNDIKFDNNFYNKQKKIEMSLLKQFPYFYL